MLVNSAQNPSGDAPLVTSPMLTTISIEAHRLTVDDTLHESHENYGADHFDVGGYMLAGSNPISRSLDTARHHDEPDPIDGGLSQNRQEPTSNSPAIIPPNNSRPSSRDSYCPAPLHTEHRVGYRPEPQYSHRPPPESSHHSPPQPNNAETAARGYLPAPPSPEPLSSAQSARPPAVASSVSSRVTRPVTPVRTASITHTPRRGNRSSTPTSARQRAHEPPQDTPELRQVVHQTTGSIHHDSHSATASLRPSTTPPEGRLRPMIGINRYKNSRKVKIDIGYSGENHVLLPVTTKFVG